MTLSEPNEINAPGCNSEPVGSESLSVRPNHKPRSKSLGLE